MEITSRCQLRDILKYEKRMYFNEKGIYQTCLKILKGHPDFFVWKYIKRLRITSYYYTKRKCSFILGIIYVLSCRRMYRLGRKLGIESGENVFGKGIKIFHASGIVINGNARIGDHCYLYGNNCIGNNGITNKCPVIGNNVRLCVGSKILGDVRIADNVVVAAGAVVISSCLEEGALLAGVPAQVVAYNNTENRFL